MFPKHKSSDANNLVMTKKILKVFLLWHVENYQLNNENKSYAKVFKI